MGLSINGPSGIDTAYIIDSLVNLETNSRVTPVKKLKAAYELKIEAYSSFQALVSDMGAKAFALGTAASFSLFTKKSSNENIVTVDGSTGGQPGSYNVNVFHTATAEKMISRGGLISSHTRSLSSQGISTGTIRINGAEITIGVDDTINDLRMKINTAVDSTGKKIGVTASVIKASDSDYRLVLTAQKTGASGVAYQDVDGATLQNLGIILNAAGDKGITAQTLSSAVNIADAFNALALGGAIFWSGADHNGNAVSGTFVKSAGSTLESFLQQIERSYHGMAVAQTDASGNLVITDKITGVSQLSMTSLTFGGVACSMHIAVAGAAGEGVLAAGSNAYFSIDGLMLESSANNAEGFIPGVTLNLKKANPNEAVAIEVDRDYDAIAAKIQKMIDAYNALLRFQKEKTRYGNPDDKTSKKGDLSGDQSVGMVISQFRAQIQMERGFSGSALRRLADLGLKTDYVTGEFTLDRDKLQKALERNFDDAINLFITAGASTFSGITYGRSTADTQPGEYELEESGSVVRIRKQGASEWFEADARNGDIVTFSDGPAKGLSLTMAPGVIPEGTTATFTLSKGLSDDIKQLSDTLNNSRDGLIANRQQSYRRSIDAANDRIDRLNDSIERYRQRLVKQFSAMEQMLSQLQGQSAKMLNAVSSLNIYNK